ncbi:hypothetical protein FKW77_010505 [Venturia effusa]|uniref:Uncharacterized protein n=1 Tax=Venturia effusa TaxID=50376 RepID=A0A517L0M2_9PEZI|nr:hypothetical protein FKW77_010505 [Venturia effusa]
MRSLQPVRPGNPATALDPPGPFNGVAITLLPTVHTENPATSPIVPPEKPQAAADSFNFPGVGQEPPLPPQITPGPRIIGSFVLDGATVPVNAIPAVPATSGPYVERPTLVAVGGNTMTLGVTGTYDDKVLAIKTAAGGVTVAVVGNAQDQEPQTFTLNVGDGVANAITNGPVNTATNGGGVFENSGGEAASAPTPIATRPEVTAAGMTFTPAADGGYIIAGASLSLGGPPVTIYGTSNAEPSLSDSGSGSESGGAGNRPSPTVLSLMTDANGGRVLVINGTPTALPAEAAKTGEAKPTQDGTSDESRSTLGPRPAFRSRPTSGLGPGTGSGTIGTGNSAKNGEHKNAACRGLSETTSRWLYGAGIGIMASISW